MSDVVYVEYQNRAGFLRLQKYQKAAVVGMGVCLLGLSILFWDRVNSLNYLLAFLFVCMYFILLVNFFSYEKHDDKPVRITDLGIEDTRVVDGVIPWDAIQEIKPFGYGNIHRVVLVVSPSIIEKRKLTFRSFLNLIEVQLMNVDATINICADNLSVSSFDLWLSVHQHHRRWEQNYICSSSLSVAGGGVRVRAHSSW